MSVTLVPSGDTNFKVRLFNWGCCIFRQTEVTPKFTPMLLGKPSTNIGITVGAWLLDDSKITCGTLLKKD
jgi:hypothetical protein